MEQNGGIDGAASDRLGSEAVDRVQCVLKECEAGRRHRPPLSTDTIKVLEDLLDGARRGEVVGIAYAVLYRGRQTASTPRAKRTANPTFTRGMVPQLSDELGRRERGE